MNYMFEPQKTIRYYHTDTIGSAVTFSELMDALQSFKDVVLTKFPVELDDQSIKISAVHYYDNSEIMFCFDQTVPNPTYEQEMEKYMEWQEQCKKERLAEKEKARIAREASETKLAIKRADSELRFAKKISSIMEDETVPYGKRAAEVEALIAKKYCRRGNKSSKVYK